jgi:SAM-dependent methyltransferase
MTRRNPGYARLARGYRALEFLAFGGDLERARFAHLDRLAPCRSILLLGEGDGRCVRRLAELAPGADIVCVDSSPEMIGRAARRLRGGPTEGRVRFICSDIGSFEPEPGAFDAVVTFFFLDCFDERGVASIVARMGPALRPGALWLFADFAVPAGGFARLRAQAWLRLLYTFFRWETGLGPRSLPPSEAILAAAGWRAGACLVLQSGLLRSAVFARTGVPATGAREASQGPVPTGSL